MLCGHGEHSLRILSDRLHNLSLGRKCEVRASVCASWATAHLRRHGGVWLSESGGNLCRVPAASVVLNIFLLGSVTGAAWARFAVWVAGALVVYAVYSLPASYAHHTSRLGATSMPSPYGFQSRIEILSLRAWNFMKFT